MFCCDFAEKKEKVSEIKSGIDEADVLVLFTNFLASFVQRFFSLDLLDGICKMISNFLFGS